MTGTAPRDPATRSRPREQVERLPEYNPNCPMCGRWMRRSHRGDGLWECRRCWLTWNQWTGKARAIRRG